jgi:hypothetical protein
MMSSRVQRQGGLGVEVHVEAARPSRGVLVSPFSLARTRV